jgi:hypothetical protein
VPAPASQRSVYIRVSGRIAGTDAVCPDLVTDIDREINIKGVSSLEQNRTHHARVVNQIAQADAALDVFQELGSNTNIGTKAI